jgi:CubicO group peptidase (beta-lactamase class C family)
VAEQLVNGIIDGTYPDVRAIAIHHKGVLLLEEYFYGYDRDRPHQMRSLTKSVISLLAGVAVDRGLLRADEPVLTRLGYATYQNPDARKARVTLSDLLSNQSGFACNDYDRDSPGNEVKLYETSDWARAFADLPVAADPGTVGRYCSGGIITTGRIIEHAAGTPLPTFAQDVLFGPLGIRPADWKWDFTLNRSQRNEFGQVHLRPRDMLKLGILIQQRGDWEGRRVVSAAWIDAAVARQSHIDDSDYGLGIWHRWYQVQTPAGERRVDTIMLSGNGGQKVYLVPSLDLIVVFTGGAFNVESPVNTMMARVLLPALMGTGSSRQPPPNGRP